MPTRKTKTNYPVRLERSTKNYDVYVADGEPELMGKFYQSREEEPPKYATVTFTPRDS